VFRKFSLLVMCFVSLAFLCFVSLVCCKFSLLVSRSLSSGTKIFVSCSLLLLASLVPYVLLTTTTCADVNVVLNNASCADVLLNTIVHNINVDIFHNNNTVHNTTVPCTGTYDL